MKRTASSRVIVSLGAMWVLLAAAPWARAQPVGNEFRVNSATTGGQTAPAVAAAGNGDFVVVWHTFAYYGGDTLSASVMGQRYAASGSAQGSNFLVNTYTPSYQQNPTVAMEPDGDFVVVWLSGGGQDGYSQSVQGQRFASDGSPRGPEFQVNTYTTSNQTYPSVGVGTAGDFVVVWQSYGALSGDDSEYSIQGQRYDSVGIPRGGEFQVNTYTTNRQYRAVVAMEPDGDFVVAWSSNGSSGGDATGILGRRYASDGTARGDEFQVNGYTTGIQQHPAIAVKADGAFVVSWDGTDSDDDTGVQARRFASDGSPLGQDFQVNTYTTGVQSRSSVGLDADGDFVVSWKSEGSSGTDTAGDSTQLRRYASDGTPRGPEFQGNLHTTGHQGGFVGPAVALTPQGTALLVWQSNTEIGHDWDVYGRAFTQSELSVTDASVTEGDVPATFTVTLSAASDADVTVDWATALIGGAQSGVDYTAASGTLTIAAGLTSGTFAVTVLADALDEGPEYFYVNLSNATGGIIADGQGRGLISDDDPTPVLAFGGAAEPVSTEGDTGTTPQSFIVTLTGPTARTVDVNFATGSSGTATSGLDYAARTGMLRFTPGQTSKTLKVFITGDTLDEARETYFVNLSSPVNATIGDTQSMGTIVDNDATPAGSPALSISDTTIAEPATGSVNATFTVTLSAPATTAVSFTYGTGAGGTATTGTDYVAFVLKTATIAVGQTTKTITAAVWADVNAEPSETFFVNVTSASNATLLDAQGQATILNTGP